MAEHDDDLDRRIRAAWRDLDDDDGALDPAPAGIWEGIAAAAADLADPAEPAEPARPAAPAASAEPAVPTEEAGRRGWFLGAAAAVLVLLVLGAVVWRVIPSGDEAEYRAVLTTDGLPVEPGPHGDAVLVGTGTDRRLRLELSDLPDIGDDAVLEVWLLDPDGGGLQPLGLVDGGASFPVPPAVDTDRYSVVDVSVEPTDGDPTHSSDSILRGPLEPT